MRVGSNQNGTNDMLEIHRVLRTNWQHHRSEEGCAEEHQTALRVRKWRYALYVRTSLRKCHGGGASCFLSRLICCHRHDISSGPML